ncbi:transcriptional regulatory [Apiospora saccharicola]|uniref:Transcriptional regulatory n=1 Tax=Apiospora saccharicola TaxID=335842 RepID=A0ABR1WCW9_9PEZI
MSTAATASQSRRYMSKKQRPCDYCRARKSACRLDRGPPCRLCQMSGRECTFLDRPATRRTPVAGSSGSPGARSDDSGPQQQHEVTPPALPGSPEPGPSVETPFDLEMAMDSIPDWPPYLMNESDFDAIFNQELPVASKASSVSAPPKPNPDGYSGLQVEFLGLSSDMDPFMLQMYKYNDQSLFKFKELAVQRVQDGPLPSQLLVSPETLYHSRRAETGTAILSKAEAKAKLEALIDQNLGGKLIDLFRRFIQPQFPVFSTEDWPTPTESPAHLLAALYAITLPFTLFDDCLNVDTAYDPAIYPDLYSIINTALSYYIHTPNIAIVQTLLLLTLRPSNIHTYTDAAHRWALLGTLTSHAVTIGLHQDTGSWIIPPWQIAQRRRLSFLILAADRWLSCGYGKPPHIHEDNWMVTALQSNDQLGCGVDEDQWSQVIHFSSLTGALGDVLSKLYSLRATSKLSTSVNDTMGAAHPILDQLTSLRQYIAPEAITELLGCLYAELMVLRAMSRPWLVNKDSTSTTNDSATATIYDQVRLRTRECTKQLSELVCRLGPEHTAIFWPPWSQMAFSSLFQTQMTMAISSRDAKEASVWIGDLMTARKGARLRIQSFPQLRLGLIRIDSLFWRGIENLLHLTPHVREAFRAHQTQ